MRHWYVVHTQPKNEIKAALNLERQNFEVYLPYFRAKRRHARRVEEISRPLFPGYLFISIDPDQDGWRSVNGTFGVQYLISQNDEPLPVPGGVVESIKDMEDASGHVTPRSPMFQPGQPVEILEGPMTRQVGLFEQLDDKERVVLLISLLGRQVRVKLPHVAVFAA